MEACDLSCIWAVMKGLKRILNVGLKSNNKCVIEFLNVKCRFKGKQMGRLLFNDG